MDMDTGHGPQPGEVLLDPLIVLAPVDAGGHGLVECLDADLELQRPGRELFDDPAQRGWQPVRDHLEMDKQTGTISFEEKLENRLAGPQIEVEGAVDKLELAGAAIQ